MIDLASLGLLSILKQQADPLLHSLTFHQTDMAERLGITPKTLRRYLDVLKDAKHIDVNSTRAGTVVILK